MFDFSVVTTWIDELLRVTLGLNNFWTLFIEFILIGVVVSGQIVLENGGLYSQLPI